MNLSAETYPLPNSKVNLNYSDTSFKNIYDAVCLGVFFYKLDTIKKYSKDILIKEYGSLLLSSGVRFDLNNIDIGKKGWTRYYPFSIGGRDFIMRIFLTAEAYYQPKVTVLYEGTLADPAVTFQVLPSLNDILADCKIKPLRTYSSSQSDRSS